MPYDPNEIRHGWYSPTADAIGGHAVYLDMNGKEVLVTEVVTGSNEKLTQHDDVVCVGQLKSFVRAQWGNKRYMAY